jgi:anti-sigma factor RsiW
MTGANQTELLCRELVDLVTEYLGDTLPPRDRARFEQHLLDCPPCTAYLAQMRATLALAAELRSTDAPPADEVAQQLDELFRRWRGKQEP